MMNWEEKPRGHEGLHLGDGPKPVTSPKAIVAVTLVALLGAAGLYAYRNTWVDRAPSASRVVAPGELTR